jgi:hypothetical protein
MSKPTLDGAGLVKMAVLEDAQTKLQTLHGLVERMALEVRNDKPISGQLMAFKRTLTPLVGLLKGQFGMISDQCAAMNLVASRGGPDKPRLRALREGVATVRTALEIAVAQTEAKHKKVEDAGAAAD